ncbi:MAG: HupE/UreJ family protein [Gammaproteobacteria bacterium]|nr:HupE/UreJ family protein [Gammaproteobacteria bacterium]
MIRALFALLVMTWSLGTAAHEVRPAYLLVQDISSASTPDRYDFTWRVPGAGEGIPLTIFVVMPEPCRVRTEAMRWNERNMRVSKWIADCAGGLSGRTLEIGALSSSVTDVLVRYERLDGTTQVVRLSPTSTSFEVTASETWLTVAGTYTLLGIEHILLGIDHLLFVLALLIIVADWRKLVVTITSFTLAHSVTLGAASLGWVFVPQKPVEAVIALSILFVAMEIVHWRNGRPGITRQWPWVVAFIFGLLHGFGFAGALANIGLPEHAIPLALLFFNVGVELGQLAFIAAALLSWAVVRRIHWPAWAWRIPVYAIGSMAAFWTIDRIAGF